MRDTVAALQRGKAAVAVITSEFTRLAALVAARSGWAGMRTTVLPYPLVTRSEAELKEIAHEYFPELLRSIGVDS